ncbi:MAG: hypothetical protein RMM29_05975 [Planctomycetota bacterium]|nr:hypothetical protein [Planctomycetota bacterium]MCX8040432.1 hypothetical protein [Planctomycetota bacterium]MDW8373180.1 hypothetical protein [Planctomycetota bacterium]
MPCRQHCVRWLLLACTAVGSAAAAVGAQPTPEYQAELAELQQMLEKRQLDVYEMQFIPGRLGRVSIVGRNGREHRFHYLLFTVRNLAVSDDSQLALRARGYHEVLQAIAKEYERARIETEHGVRLRVEGVEQEDSVVLERLESAPRTRTLLLTALATTENGTRIRLLDEPPGSGPQESYAFPDLGEPTWQAVARRVQERVEEIESRKLLTTQMLRQYPLPPCDGQSRVQASDIEDASYDTRGWLVGEAHVVLLFPRLSDYGDEITIRIHGLSNKIRVKFPPAEPGKPENFFTAKVLRRTMVLEYRRAGDEYDRDDDAFELVRYGYRWEPSFQRLETLRTVAYSNYFLDHITDRLGRLDAAIGQRFWPYYEEQRERYPQLPDLQASLPR